MICVTAEEGTKNRPLVEGRQQHRNWVTSCGLPPTFLFPVLCLVTCFYVVPNAQLSYRLSSNVHLHVGVVWRLGKNNIT